MRGLVLERGELRFSSDLPEPEPGPGEVRVRVLCTGVCATDLALARGYMGFAGVPGHEFVGEALEGELAGRRVVGEINAACGRCATCRAGRERHCPERSVLGILARPGAFAETLSLPQRNLHAVPDGLATERAVFAEPLAAAFEIPEQLELASVERALVVGDGRLGLLCAQVIAAAGVRTELAGRHPERGSWLPAGISHIGPVPDPREAGRPWDLVVEATGDPSVLAQALGLVRPRGSVVLKTTSERPASLDLAPLVVDEIQLLGSRCGPFEPALRALAEGVVVVDPMVEERFPLERAVDAFERARRPGTLKVLVDVAPPSGAAAGDRSR